MSQTPDLPRLDCHAHIAPDVTTAQIAALGGTVIFAMTRTRSEAAAAGRRQDSTIVWGYGAHPGVKGSLDSITATEVHSATSQHVIIGEVGLDRSTALAPQLAALNAILDGCDQQPVLISLHSTGRTAELVAALERRPHPGAILHWFNGTPAEIERATELGCFFSVNAAMNDERLTQIPLDRLLPETDFPSSRRSTRAKLPGDIDYLESRVASLRGIAVAELRRIWFMNLSEVLHRSGAENRMPAGIRRLLATLP